MWEALRASWTLLLGMLLLMVSNGLLVTLLTLRAGDLGFSETQIGLMQSGYPLGAIVSCIVTPRLVVAVGHVRVFGAFASIVSAAALAHLISSDVWVWTLTRAVSGFCFAGLYVVSESWLNGRASNATRGALLSVYFLIQTGGSMIGQGYFLLASPEGFTPFVLTSMLISVAAAPILLASVPGPTAFEAPERLSPLALYRLSPMGLVGSLVNGAAQGAIYVATGVYAVGLGFAPGAVAALVAMAALGGALGQFPLGRASDLIDRRVVVGAAAAGAIPLCLWLASLERADAPLIFVGVALLGALALPIYSLCVAHVNDALKPGQVVAASGTLVLALNAGVVLGPLGGGAAIAALGPGGFFLFIAGVMGAQSVLAFVRLAGGAARTEEGASAAPVSQYATPVAARMQAEQAMEEAADR